jgi:adenine C2-methylase RlmN of 23S rRNA A2503 and tRNA A37
MQITKTLELHFNLEVRYAKWKDKYKAISDEYRLIGRSNKDFDEAQANLINQIEVKIWSESFNLKFNIKERK